MNKLNQPDSIELELNGQIIVLDELSRLYDCGVDFNIELTSDQIALILKKNPSIILDLRQLGDDPFVGDCFFAALVQEICGESLDLVKKKYGASYYQKVTDSAEKQGYKKVE